MKFIRKKTTRGREYYYFEYPLRIQSGRALISFYIGSELPEDLEDVIERNFAKIAQISTKSLNTQVKNYFSPRSAAPIENNRFWYQSLHTEVFETDLRLFRSLFAILFILNSNRSEGSSVTRKDIEKLIQRKKQVPKTLLDIEITNSLAALRFAFSHEMKWNLKSLTQMHRLLFNRVSPEIAGLFKRENVVINNEQTTDWKHVKKELQQLFRWFLENKKKEYAPILALEFHHRFERIHPFVDGNGRIGRLLFNAFLLQQGYMPTIFFSENHRAYSDAISKARTGRKKKLARYFISQVIKTRKAIEQYKKEQVIKGGSRDVGRWEIESGKIRRF